MKLKHISASLALLIAFGIFTAFHPEKILNEGEGAKLDALLDILERAHYAPLEFDDDFSSRLFDTYLERVDFNKRFLTQEDMDQLEEFRYSLDDQINAREADFYHLVQDASDKGIERSKIFMKEILSQPFDFTIEESLITKVEDIPRPLNEDGMKEHWRKSLKYEVLDGLRTKLESQEKKSQKDTLSSEDQEFVAKSVEELESELREETQELYEEYYERLDDLREVEKFGEYLNSITNLFDPHTDYFSPRAKEDFDINMGGSLEGIGARLANRDDYVTIMSVIPGGPAWKQKELEVDDKIISVAQDGEEPVQVAGWRTQDVVPMIRGPKGTKVILTVEKVDGEEAEIVIIRDKVILDEGKARSVIIDREGVLDNVGYINLPRFYADFDDPKANTCADDIKIELEKLKAQQVSGIILDLRNNGGGSLQDVVKMSGYFIEDGPIVQVKGREKNPRVLRDTDKEIVYDGPLIIMVNHNSASASEILAAALQDYGRAVIVGSNSTFGKGTVQRFLNMDRYVLGNDEFKPLGELKVTMQKFYRVNGGSTQLKGVVPDVILPNNRHYVKYGEKQFDHPLEWTEIEAVKHELNVAKISDIGLLQNRSSERISKSDEFNLVLENAERLKRLRDFAEYPLEFDSFDALMDARKEEGEKFKNIFEPIAEMKVENLPVDIEYIQTDSSRIGRNENFITNISKDHYIDESIHILKDLTEMPEYARKN